jgi:glutamyl-Q tRNA(Asp) synthetase
MRLNCGGCSVNSSGPGRSPGFAPFSVQLADIDTGYSLRTDVASKRNSRCSRIHRRSAFPDRTGFGHYFRPEISTTRFDHPLQTTTMPAAEDIAAAFPLACGYRGRFAPSPTGPLHLGSLLAAFGSWLMARHAGGEWWVRIEDLDPPREVPGAAEAQLRTLAAFGLVSDGPVIRQRDRHARYQAALTQLMRDGTAFDCRCSRSDLAVDAGIHRACVAAPLPTLTVAQTRRAPAVASRFRVEDDSCIAFEDAIHGRVEQQVDQSVGDFVLRRADGFWAYQLAVVVDDAEQGITHIVRGADLLDSTPRQILLQRALGLPMPHYAHLPLVLDADGRKLSKSLSALPVDAGDPLPALRLVWRALGQVERTLDGVGSIGQALTRAMAEFDPSLISRNPVRLAALHNGVVHERP